MCGIWGCVGTKCTKAAECTKQLSGRGPEHMDIKEMEHCTLGFARLAINGLTKAGNQPMTDGQGIHWICNGEIYNCKELKARHKLDIELGSDCSVIGPLFRKLNNPGLTFRSLDGVFAVLIYDENNNTLYVSRDPYGVRPMFIGKGKEGGTFFGSEIKSLIEVANEINIFNPGFWAKYDGKTGQQLQKQAYHHVPFLKNPLWTPDYHKGLELASQAVRQTLTIAVKKRLMAERPVAALLSGGIDSSLVAALVQNELMALGKPPLKTFSIGFAGSPDLKYAKMVADHIKSDHTEIVSTPDEFFAAIPEVIKAIQSYDITSVRASVGNWMVCKQIRKRSDCKVVFNGDGADEVFGSYLYFKKAPSAEEFEEESARLLTDMHYYDVLRSDRSISTHGLQARTPYLDKSFVGVARAVATDFRLRPADKSAFCNEKWILRMAFEGTNTLPSQVLWRRKEAFSDGISVETKSWYEEIQERLSIENWEDQVQRYDFDHLKPYTAESFYYRKIFHEIYGKEAEKCIPYFWMPKWSGETKDPSARTLNNY